MDRNEQQLRYSNGLINSVQSDRKIGYCDTYADKNTCVCMTMKDKNSHFDELPECNGVCRKQNINIYIKNYENRRNNEKFDLKCESAGLESYPYYEIKSEAKPSAINNLYISRNNQSKSKSIYTDMLWSESPRANISNVTYYPYLNNSHKYITEGTSFVKKQADKRSINHVQVNISSRAENPAMYNDINNKKNIYRENTEQDNRVLNSVRKPAIIASSNSPSSSCNNLYVSPPYFTVDKFVNPDQSDTCRNSQITQNFCSNQLVPLNSGFEYNGSGNQTVLKGEIKNNEQFIGIQFSGNPNIDNQLHHIPIKKENCIHERIHMSSDIEQYQRGENRQLNISNMGKRNEAPISLQSIDQFNRANSMELDNQNLYRVADFNAIHNSSGSNQRNMAFHDIQCTKYQKISPHDAYEKKPYSNAISSPVKGLLREARKPNYRELINHVHALRTATSEDDLNMQIIKRTLNYNHVPNEILSPSRKISNRAFRRNVMPRTQETNEQNSINHHERQLLFAGATATHSPLDLSVKTIKTNADSTEKNLNCKILVKENGYAPKFNFRPNFSENRDLITNANPINPESNKTISNTIALNRSSIEDLKCEIDLNMPGLSTECYNGKDNISNIKGDSEQHIMDNELMVPIASAHNIKGNIIYSLQNCISPHIMKTCVRQDKEKSTGIKLEVTLKRTFENGDDNDFLQKKICLESFYHSGFDTSPSLNKYSENNNDAKNPKLISRNHSMDYSENINMDTSITKTNLVTEIQPISELQVNLIEAKPDVSSIIASRIRTKAELKGFIFQESEDDLGQKPVSDKQNCHCNYSVSPFSVQMNDVDMSEWENTCNSFVDQLRNNSKSKEFIEHKLIENQTTSAASEKHQTSYSKNCKFKSLNECNTPEINIASSVVNVETLHDKDDIQEMMNVKQNNNNNNTEPTIDIDRIESTYDNKYIEPTINNVNNESSEFDSAQNSNDVSTVSKDSDSPENSIISRAFSKERKSKEDNIDIKNILAKRCKQVNNTYNETEEYVSRNKNRDELNNEHSMLKNIKAIDLTKISVVRLKREKYASKRYTHNKICEYKQIREKEDIKTKTRNVSKIGFPSITKSALRKKKLQSGAVGRRQQNINDGGEKGPSKFDTITTRLQHQRMQLKNNTESICKSNNLDNCKRKKLRVHRQNQNDCELLNDPDKVFLEVYKYKRALKVPPNLITIKNPYVQRMSASLPDLDLPNSFIKSEALSNKNDCKADDVPKSIIDVLHSRVVKSKCQSKSGHKQYKDSHHTSKLAAQQCNNAKINFQMFNKCEDKNSISHLEHRNVFETQVLTSRTRMEYKMQLNKEVLREIFGDSDRPASAPPEINNVSNNFEITFKNRYPNCFQQAENNIENKIDYEDNKEIIPSNTSNINESIYSINNIAKEQTNNSSQAGLSTKCKRKRRGRPYRRKFSSGFDYLRKRKKSNAHALYNYSYLKKKAVDYAKETNFQFKNENDVCREIQKWVLNKGVGQSALHKAAKLGYIDVIVYCLEKMGLNPDHKDNAGFTALHDACANGSLEIVRVLLQYGANHSEGAHSGIRPLHEASENGHIEIVRMLLSYGADPLLETYAGQTPLMLSSEHEMNDFISMHLLDVNDINRSAWQFPGPWEIFDASENGYDALTYSSSLDSSCQIDKTNNYSGNIGGTVLLTSQKSSLKSDVCEIEIFVDAADAEGELFEFEEANLPLPPLYLLPDEGIQKWVLLSDLSSLLKIKSKDTLLHKIFPSISPATVSRAFIRELKMCDFLEKATCLQLLCAGEKINICHSKVVLIQYNENVRKVLGVKTVLMKF